MPDIVTQAKRPTAKESHEICSYKKKGEERRGGWRDGFFFCFALGSWEGGKIKCCMKREFSF